MNKKNMIKPLKIAILIAFLIISLKNASAETYKAEEFTKMPFLVPYAKLLNKYVKPFNKHNIKGVGVNYLAWQADPLHEEALSLLKTTDTSEIVNKEDIISFWINTYNLLTIDLIIKKGERETIHNLGGLVGDPWNEFSWVIDGLEYTLGQIHHQKLRLIGEPRVNFALTCAAVSCPDLKNTPYWPNKIYSQLEKSTSTFLKNTGKGVMLIKKAQGKSKIKKHTKFKVSQMFQWFKNDFEHGNIKSFINRYVKTYKAEFGGYLEYDWSLNALKGKEPKETGKKKTSYFPSFEKSDGQIYGNITNTSKI